MSQFYDQASLVVVPSGYKAGTVYAQKPLTTDGQLAFTRTGDTATRVNSAGLIERVRTNLVLQSETFDNASWAKTFGASITANTAANPLTGTQTADTIIADAVNNFHYISQSVTYSAGEATISVYLKANGYSWFVIDSGLSNAFGYFNLTTGAVGTKGSACATAITSAGNGWYRCSVTFTATASASTLFLSIRNADNGGSFLGDGVGGFFIYGAQAEMGVATAYIPTTTAAVSVGPVADVPRLDYLGSTCGKLLLEPQRTNNALYSEQLDNAAWTKQNTTVSANAITSPSGYQDADKLIETSATGAHRASVSSAATLNGTFSFFAKAGERTKVAILSTTIDLGFDLSSGTLIDLGSGTSAGKIENYGNGWYRCSLPQASGIVALALALLDNSGNISYTGNGTSGAYFWGAQLEVGAYATSYIPTLASASTRSADACSKTGISSLIGQTEGTLFVDFDFNGNYDANGIVAIDVLGAGNNEAYIFTTGAGQLRLELYAAGVVQGQIISSIGAVGRKKIAFAYKANDFVGYMNGVQVGTDTSGTVGAMDTIYVGTYQSPTYANGNMKQALVFKTRLTNAQLAELTTL